MGFFDAQGIDTSKPQSQQTNVNNISSWAQPYVNNYLNKAQQLVNTSGPTAFQNQVFDLDHNRLLRKYLNQQFEKTCLELLGSL